MKSTVVYYSYSGNTKKVAVVVAEVLRERGAVDEIELKPKDESKNFFKQGERAFKRVKADITGTPCDVSGYDLVCIGTPVWAFGPVPAVNSYLEQCTGIAGKKVVFFCTTGGSGVGRTMKIMRQALEHKGPASISEFSIVQSKVSNKDLIVKTVRAALA